MVGFQSSVRRAGYSKPIFNIQYYDITSLLLLRKENGVEHGSEYYVFIVKKILSFSLMDYSMVRVGMVLIIFILGICI